MFVIKRYRSLSDNSADNEINPQKKLFDRKHSPRVLIITLVSIFLAFYFVSELVYLQFSATYFQYIPLKLTASKSAEIVSAMALTYTIGRGISVFIAIKIRPQHMIAYHFLILIISIVILFSAQNSITILWFGSLTLSFGFSSIFPSIFSFISQYLIITDRIGTTLIFSSSVLNLFTPFILGTYIEKYSVIFVVSMLLNLTISIAIFVIILYIIRKTEKNNSNSISNNNEIQMENMT